MHTTPTTTAPANAAGHSRTKGFCSLPCDDCDDQMTRRSVRYQRANLITLHRMMSEAPVGR